MSEPLKIQFTESELREKAREYIQWVSPGHSSWYFEGYGLLTDFISELFEQKKKGE